MLLALFSATSPKSTGLLAFTVKAGVTFSEKLRIALTEVSQALYAFMNHWYVPRLGSDDSEYDVP